MVTEIEKRRKEKSKVLKGQQPVQGLRSHNLAKTNRLKLIESWLAVAMAVFPVLLQYISGNFHAFTRMVKENLNGREFASNSSES